LLSFLGQKTINDTSGAISSNKPSARLGSAAKEGNLTQSQPMGALNFIGSLALGIIIHKLLKTMLAPILPHEPDKAFVIGMLLGIVSITLGFISVSALSDYVKHRRKHRGVPDGQAKEEIPEKMFTKETNDPISERKSGHSMNRKQKIVLSLSLAAFSLTILNAPWTETGRRLSSNKMRWDVYTQARTAPIWYAPDNSKLNGPVILIEWAAIAIIGGGLFVLFRQPKQ
jgi:hypothetical protein